MSRLHWRLRVAIGLIFLPSLAFAAYDSAASAQQQSLEIVRITPSGEDAPAGKQIVVTFNRPVVPLGKMERDSAEIPIIISPAVPCEWRWINTASLACNLSEKEPLREATKYTVEVKPGIKAEDGTTIAQAYQHEFTTARPEILYHHFKQWKSASLPVLRLVFNQPVDKESVRKHVYLAVGEGKQRISLEVSPDPSDRTLPQFVPVPGEPYGLYFNQAPSQKSNDELRKHKGGEARSVWLVQPRRELPVDTHVILSVEEGLVSALGPVQGLEDNEVVAFDTYPAFEFLGMECSTNDYRTIKVEPGKAFEGKCNPQRGVQMVFSAPVDKARIGKMLAFTPAVGGWQEANEEGADAEGVADSNEGDPYAGIGYEYRRPHSKGNTYSLWLPNGLKAAQEYHVESSARAMGFFHRLWYRFSSVFSKKPSIDVRDIFGRKLTNSIATSFVTDHRTPNYVLDYSEAVLEKNVESELPFYVNNLNSYRFAYRRVTAAGASEKLDFTQNVPQAKDVQFAVPFGVREMLGGKSGAIYGALTTEPVVTQEPPHLFAQVTPYQVHLKLGHFVSTAWVTDMATGAPVQGARVEVYKDALSTLHAVKEKSAQATTDEGGIAMLPGTETLDPELTLTRAYGDDDQRYFIRVSKGEDVALLPVSPQFEIDSYRSSGSESVYPSNRERYGHMRAWGTTAQGIYRAGDTIQYKIYVRNQNNETFTAAPTKGYKLKIIDPMGKVVEVRKNLVLSPFGGISGEFTVPKEGAVGWYQFKLLADYAKPSDNEAESGESDEAADLGPDGRADEADEEQDAGAKTFFPLRVLVSDFTPAPFHVSTQLGGDLFHAEEKVSVTTRAELHSGGPYTDAAARITAVLDARPFTSNHPLAKAFRFDSYANEVSSQQIFQKQDAVNGKGENQLDFSMDKPQIVYGKLMVESAVADDRGKFVSSQSRADYLGVDRLVGMRSTQWIYSVGKPATLEYIVVDERGAPAKGSHVDIAIEQQVTKAAKVKGAGNAYLTEYHNDWVAAGTCKGESAEAPSDCSFTPEKAGLYRAVAKIKDSKGREHATTIETYVTGRDYVAWNDENDSSLTIVPERTDYKVGDTARYLVKNPYPGAKALITIERFGVLDHFVQTFDSSTPVVEFTVKPDYMPGFCLSVVVTSPRVEKPLGEGNVDLGKPSFRMGYLSVPVKDPYKEMSITAKTDKEVYKPREKVTVQLHAEPRMKDKKEPIELAVTVLDESVFDLIAAGKANFDPYAGFYKLESLDLRNYSLLTRLVGRQKFEKKGANPGGDGGADLSMRSIFKFVSYWNAELKTDKNGNATVTFDAPDNLTGWRVLAIATTPTDRFGLGEANFKVNRPTELRPVMPNQVLEGDRFDAGFSVMNRTDKPRTIAVTIEAEGNLDGKKTPASVTKSVTLEPFKRTTVLMPIQTTAVAQSADVSAGEIRFTAKAEDAIDGDGVTHRIPVNKRRVLEVAANYGTTTQDTVSEPVQFPKDMLPDIGGVSVVASSTVIGNVSGAFKYMRDYPYICWEQKLSKGVMAAHYKNLHAYLPDKLSWQGSDALPQATLGEAANFQAPNGGMAYFLPQDRYVDPYLSAYTALAFNWLRKGGYSIPSDVETKLQAYLSNLLKNDAVPDFYSEGMTSTVRAVALAALAERGKADLADLERYRPFVPKMSLLGKSMFLQAALAIKGGEKHAPDVAKAILSASNQTGGKFIFSEQWDDSYSRILASPLRENCAILSAFTAYGERKDGEKLVADVPFKLVRTITQTRGNRDHWENTQENMFCMNALTDFARVYEKEKPDMTVKAAMDGQPFGEASFKDVRDPTALLERAVAAGDAGRKASIELTREGTGRLYYATRVSYALPAELSKPANAGIEVRREYSVEREGKWQLLKSPTSIKRGEIVRVDLYVSVPAARNFVVVDDAVPGGLEPVNHELATSSVVDAKKGEYQAAGGSYWFKFSDWQDFGVSRWAFYHQEMRHDSVRYYSDYLPAGNYHLAYTAQAVATGEFNAMPARAAEMYDPDVYGKTEAMQLGVGEADAPAKKP